MSGGHCFISVLTPRDRTADDGIALPPPWVVNESALSYQSNRPHLVFIERGVDPVALYKEMDLQHIIEFQVLNKMVHFESNTVEKLLQFRNECEAYETDRRLQGVGHLIFVGFALYGGWKFLDDFLGK